MSREFDLEKRTLQFSKDIIDFIKLLPRNTVNYKLIDQVIRSATSIGANYREANETESDKDFKHRVRISKKEAKETIYWLDLIKHSNVEFSSVEKLQQEAVELMKILGSMYRK